MVMGLEVSRLARNNTDWHRLLEICALTDTLILDEDGLYDPGYFNDRLVTAIDNLLATPDLAQAPALTPVNGHYEYANPALESLSVGQKMLLRAGPADEAAIKAKLRDVRAQLTGKTLPAVK